MSYLASGILGTLAGTLALGAVHLEVAAGNDLLGPVQRPDASVSGTPSAQSASAAIMPNVNRASKGDRARDAQSVEGVTISFRIPGVDDSSVMMRVTVGDTSDNVKRPKAPSPIGNGTGAARRTVACEPVVSVLTAVAKQLQPSRCVT